MSNTVTPADIITHVLPGTEDMGLQAARTWLARADAMGLKMGVWAQEAIAKRVGPEGGRIAELTAHGPWHVVVENNGRTTAHTGNVWNCQTCENLAALGRIPKKED